MHFTLLRQDNKKQFLLTDTTVFLEALIASTGKAPLYFKIIYSSLSKEYTLASLDIPLIITSFLNVPS